MNSLLCLYDPLDLPYLVRLGWRNNVSDIPLDVGLPMHVDIPRLREGKVGGFFWYAFSHLFRARIDLAWVQVCICALCRELSRGKGLFDFDMEGAVCLSQRFADKS